MLRARTFGARRKSLLARYANAYERARNFLRPVLQVFFKDFTYVLGAPIYSVYLNRETSQGST